MMPSNFVTTSMSENLRYLFDIMIIAVDCNKFLFFYFDNLHHNYSIAITLFLGKIFINCSSTSILSPLKTCFLSPFKNTGRHSSPVLPRVRNSRTVGIYHLKNNGFLKFYYEKIKKSGLKSCVGSGIQIKNTERSPTRAAAQLAPPPDTPLKKMGFEKSIFSEKKWIFKNPFFFKKMVFQI